ncbi:MAG: hypothetical protein WCP28_03345 [Actinomycetes bacterium]
MLVLSAPTVAPGGAAATDDFLAAGSFVSDSMPREEPAVDLPGVDRAYVDPVFGTTIRQLTGSADAGVGFVPEYSKVGAFNADGSLFLIRGTDASTYLFDGRTLAMIRMLPIPVADSEPRWSPTDPDTLTYLDNAGVAAVMEYSVASDTSRLLGAFNGVGEVSSGAEQDRSRSGRYFALHGAVTYDANGDFVSAPAFVADLVTGAASSVKILTPPTPGDFLDYVSITPDDAHVMVMWARAGAQLYDRATWAFVRQLTDWDEHADFCRTSSGEDVLVIAHYRADPNDQVVEAVPLSGARRRVLWQAPTYNMGLHVSCRNTALPGWVFLSSYWDGPGQRPLPGPTSFENEVFALSLDSTQGSPAVRRLAHTGMTERADYYDEPHAGVSRDGRLVLFGSNFGQHQTSESFDNAFAVDLRTSAQPQPPAGASPTTGPSPPAAQKVQTVLGTVVARLRVGRVAVLPRRTISGRHVTFKSKTPRICAVARGRVAGRAAGQCWLAARAPVAVGYRAFRARFRVRIVR